MLPFIVHADDIPEDESHYPPPFDGEALSFGRDLGRAVGVERLGTWVERIPPGRRTSRLHAHLREEETIYVLAGEPVLYWRAPDGPKQQVALRPGSFVAFRAGTGIAHYVHNPGPEEAKLLVVGERQPGERIAYPEDPDLDAWRAEQGSNRRWIDVQERHPFALAPAWRIRTARLEIRPWRLTDVAGLVALQNNNREHLLPWMPWAQLHATEDEAAQRVLTFHGKFARGEDFLYGIFLDGAAIGGTGLHLRVGPRAAEIGYWISKEHEGKGLITEAVRAMARIGLEVHGYARIEIRMDPTNLRSAAVPPRVGFTLETTLRRRFEGPEGLHDVHLWALYKEQVQRLGGPAPLGAWDLLDRRLL